MTATMGAQLRRYAGRIAFGMLLAVVLVWALFPFYWAFVNSVKTPAQTFEGSWVPFLQFAPTLEHWRTELALPEIQRALMNSAMIAVGGASLALALGAPAGYALARFRFRVRQGSLLTWFISQRVLPPVIFVVPFFLIMRETRLLDTVAGLILLNATFTLPFVVVIMSQMIRVIPVELEEAAWVDGASLWAGLRLIVLPLVLPGLVASWIIAMAFSWNEFLMAVSLTTKSAVPMTVIIAGAEHTRGVSFWFVGVRTLVTVLPPIAIALLAQRYVVRGLTLGGVKG